MKDLDLIVTTGLLEIMEEAGDAPGEQTASIIIHKILESARSCVRPEDKEKWNDYLAKVYNKFKFDNKVH